MSRSLIVTSKAPGNPEHNRVFDLAREIARGGSEIGVLFVGDGVYSLFPGAEGQAALSETGVKLFASLADLERRNLKEKVVRSVQAVSYEKIVDLVMKEYSNVISYL